jgi:adhesin/invasin
VVAFAVAGGHGTLGPTTDRGDGRYTAEYTGRVIAPGGADTITARIEGTPVRTPPPAIAVVAGTISPAQSTVSVASRTVAVGDSVLVTLVGRDAAGRALVTGDRSEAIAFTQGAGAGESGGVFGPVVNRDDGTYVVWFHGRVAGGPVEIGATIGGAAVTTALPTVTVTPGPPAVTTSRVVVAGADSVVVGDTTTVELQVFDAFGNAVSDPGLAVAFAATPAVVGSVGAASYRSGNRYAAVFRGLAPGTALVRASIGGATVLTAPAVVRVR